MRRESDVLGSLDLPDDAYYGVHTARAVGNFPVGGVPISVHPPLVIALAAVKAAAATANTQVGALDQRRARAIQTAAEEIRAGALHEHFVVGVLQGGAGTSSNMNANEVICNRALEHLGAARGAYDQLHPVDHVNRSQSTNDAYPTALRAALILEVSRLRSRLLALTQELGSKAATLDDVIKVGRTQLQDAVPMTLGQELRAQAHGLRAELPVLASATTELAAVNLGGTAIGTGLNAPAGYAPRAVAALSELTGLQLRAAEDLVEASQDTGALVGLSAALRRLAVKLSKFANDLRLLASGPGGGFGDVVLPAVQAGSSIMPGKVNPVVAEHVNQVCFSVMAGDVLVGIAAEAGQLQLNAFEPVMAHALLQGTDHLAAACDVLWSGCLAGLDADRDALRRRAERAPSLVTALVPTTGYDVASAVARQAEQDDAPVVEVAQRLTGLGRARLEALLDPRAMTQGPAPR